MTENSELNNHIVKCTSCIETLHWNLHNPDKYNLCSEHLKLCTKLICGENKTDRRLVIIESPYADNIERNIIYARRCLMDSLARGEAPIASHLLYTQVLDDTIPEERQMGIDAGLAWREVTKASIIYTDYGVTKGMSYGLEKAITSKISIEFREIGKNSATKD